MDASTGTRTGATQQRKLVVREHESALNREQAQHFFIVFLSRYVMSPPIREDPHTKKYLIDALKNGSLDCVATDNCTFSACRKYTALMLTKLNLKKVF